MATETRETTFMAMNSGAMVAAGSSVIIVGRQQLPTIEPYKLFIPKYLAPDFQIEDVRVGNRTMFPMGQSLTAEQFSNGDGHVLKCEPLHIGMDFIMQVTNISGCSRHFRSSWACYLPKEQPLPREFQPYSPLDYIRDYGKRAVDSVRDKVQEVKDRVVEVVSPKKPPTRQLPKPRDPHNFGWDPYGDD